MVNSLVRVVIMATPRLLVDALVKTLQSKADMTAVGVAYATDDALRQVLAANPDVAIVDTDWPAADAFEFVAKIREQHRQTKVAFLVGEPPRGRMEQALRLHTSGFISKEETVAGLVTQVRWVASGQVVYSAAIEKFLDYDRHKQSFAIRIDSPLEDLTDRQLEIFRHLAVGESVKEVARKLYLSPKAVESHKYRIMKRLGIRDRVHLARVGIREGLVQP